MRAESPKNTMTSTTFATYIRQHTKTNSTTYSDAAILADANVIKDELAKEVLKVNEDYFGMSLTRTLEAGKRHYGFPMDILNQMKYLEAQIDGVTWQPLTETDLGTYKGATDEASITANFAGKYNFDIFGGELWILCGETIIDVVSGLKLWSMQWPEDLAALNGTTDMSIPSSNVTVAMPRALHEIWARKVIIAYKESKEKPIPLSEKELRVEADLALALNSLRGANLSRTGEATTPRDNGSNY